MNTRPMQAAVVSWLATIAIAAVFVPVMLAVVLLGFVQNLSHTFVSRGRNSASLTYHLVASLFSNGIWASMLFMAVDIVSHVKTSPAAFISLYATACMAGSVFAHGLALRLEKGKGARRNESAVWDGWIPGDPEELKPADWREQRKVFLDRKYNRNA